jgi:hypothetical protein
MSCNHVLSAIAGFLLLSAVTLPVFASDSPYLIKPGTDEAGITELALARAAKIDRLQAQYTGAAYFLPLEHITIRRLCSLKPLSKSYTAISQYVATTFRTLWTRGKP